MVDTCCDKAKEMVVQLAGRSALVVHMVDDIEGSEWRLYGLLSHFYHSICWENSFTETTCSTGSLVELVALYLFGLKTVFYALLSLSQVGE